MLLPPKDSFWYLSSWDELVERRTIGSCPGFMRISNNHITNSPFLNGRKAAFGNLQPSPKAWWTKTASLSRKSVLLKSFSLPRSVVIGKCTQISHPANSWNGNHSQIMSNISTLVLDWIIKCRFHDLLQRQLLWILGSILMVNWVMEVPWGILHLPLAIWCKNTRVVALQDVEANELSPGEVSDFSIGHLVLLFQSPTWSLSGLAVYNQQLRRNTAAVLYGEDTICFHLGPINVYTFPCKHQGLPCITNPPGYCTPIFDISTTFIADTRKCSDVAHFILSSQENTRE